MDVAKKTFGRALASFALLAELYTSGVSAQVPEFRPLQVYSNPRTINVDYRLQLRIMKKAEGEEKRRPWFRFGVPASPTLYAWVSQPRTWEEQWATEPRWLSAPPHNMYIDAENNNLIDVWQKTDVAMGDTLVIYKRFKVTSYEVHYTVDPAIIGEYHKGSYIFRQYTGSEEGIEQTGEIRELARLIVGDEKNPYMRARLLFGWIILNISFLDEGQAYSALKVLETRAGDSAHYALLFVALCRSLDIPTRVVCGHWTVGDRGIHVWSEFYLPNFGWIPVDAAEADYNDPDIITNELYNRYFGHLDNKSIIISKGTNILLWPRVSGKWLADFGITADGRSQMMQIVDYALEGLDALVEYRYTWSFYE